MIRYKLFNIFIMLLTVLSISSCDDDSGFDAIVQSERDDDKIRTHLQFDLELKEGIDYQRTESGIYYQTLKKGEGDTFANDNDSLLVNYTGWVLYENNIFDSSILRDSPLQVVLPFGIPTVSENIEEETNDDGDVISTDTTYTVSYSSVIEGWTEALSLMQEGDSMRFYIPSGLGYGTQGNGSSIPANATLVFDMKLEELYAR
ncbi:FKBP-type peptidyl-prolyl cis-trans isomerase [Limibacter armeniacum]|uniref:FKBP-type peptidyl-prolyl cis-trans isomerase n=1 Tax=Limibacter armeniacum TaxID=466084 RepID=UPI002FE62970